MGSVTLAKVSTVRELGTVVSRVEAKQFFCKNFFKFEKFRRKKLLIFATFSQ